MHFSCPTKPGGSSLEPPGTPGNDATDSETRPIGCARGTLTQAADDRGGRDTVPQSPWPAAGVPSGRAGGGSTDYRTTEPTIRRHAGQMAKSMNTEPTIRRSRPDCRGVADAPAPIQAARLSDAADLTTDPDHNVRSGRLRTRPTLGLRQPATRPASTPTLRTIDAMNLATPPGSANVAAGTIDTGIPVDRPGRQPVPPP
jgi:hypothetical protein